MLKSREENRVGPPCRFRPILFDKGIEAEVTRHLGAMKPINQEEQ
jgi:hypothetical protein